LSTSSCSKAIDELPQELLRQNQELRQQGLGIENLEMRQGNVEPKNNVLMEQTHFLLAVAVLLKALFKKGMEPIPEKNIRSGAPTFIDERKRDFKEIGLTNQRQMELLATLVCTY
jgi:hypothetical protein